jgi:hypothetical protein
MSYFHGVYNSEIDTSLTAPIQGSAGLQVIFGTAPIHLSNDPAAAVNKPMPCYSFTECQQNEGYSDNFKDFTLCESMDACFRVFNIAPIILVNVLDPKKASHTTVNAAEECAVTDGQALYTKPYVLLDSLSVKNVDADLAAGSDYVATHDDDGNVLITLLSTAAKEATALTVSSKSLNPAGVTREDVVGGVDALTGQETGLELIRHIYPTLGMTPGLLLAPGWSEDPVVAAALQAKTEAINGVFVCNCLLDIPTTGENGAAVYTKVKTAKEKLGASSNHAAALWPMVAVGDKIYHYSAMFGALTAYTDASNSDVPYESPSNKDLKITATVLADGTEVILDAQQVNDVLNANGIISAINDNGFKSWGNSTAAYPSTTDPKDRWFAVRRFFDWDGNNFIRTYRQKVDKPGNKRLIQAIVDSQNIVGNGYVARDYCAGYRMEFLEDENPSTNLLNGHLTVHTYMAPFIPAEYIENIREFDVDALSAALTS